MPPLAMPCTFKQQLLNTRMNQYKLTIYYEPCVMKICMPYYQGVRSGYAPAYSALPPMSSDCFRVILNDMLQ